MYFFWTEVRFIVNLPEGLTLRIYLTSEKEQYTKVNCMYNINHIYYHN